MNAWEKRKLGDILNYEQPTPYIVRSENYQNSFPTPVLTAGKSLLLGYTNETNGIKSASKSSPVIIFDDFTTSSHLIDFPFKIKSSAMKILSPSNNDSDIYFSFGLLSSINYVSKNHERHWISQFSNFRVQVPSVHEQACVSRVLLNVTDLIAATQHKIDALEQVKKALLQRLFDQSWRFDGYLETWKKYRLGDHAEILTGGTPKTSVAEYWEPKSIPWMSSGEVNKVYLDQTDTMISLEGFKNSSARWIKKHSILIALAGQGKTRGTVAVNNIALTTNQSIAAIIPGKDLYYEFVFQNLTNRYNELRLISSGDGTRGGLNKQIVSDVTIHSPNLNEQIRIGKLLSKVDHLSTENQLKLSRIELIKKYLLQTLFI